ncbi:MAG TPA: hypothetical protein VF546_19655 [Pyrinomonadaceae bacterium]|jgi:hypothetical protein
MRQACGAHARARGGARLNFLIVLMLLGVGAYLGYQFVPLLYRATLYETFMQDTVNQAAITTKSPAWVEQQLRANLDDYGLPTDAQIETGAPDGRITARVQFSSPISLVFTTYLYKFDHTVKSATLLTNG